MQAWPHWKDKVDGTQYDLKGFCCIDVEGEELVPAYVLEDIKTGMVTVTPYPGMAGSVIEQDTSRN